MLNPEQPPFSIPRCRLRSGDFTEKLRKPLVDSIGWLGKLQKEGYTGVRFPEIANLNRP